MLVSLACVIILMLAYTQLFSDVGGRISDARSMIELETRMRSASNRLRTDLAAVTCDMLPPLRPEAGAGYFEYIEGPLSDQNPGYTSTLYPAATYPNMAQFLGDTDDVLMFTVRSKEGPFTGKYTPPSGATTTVQSEIAEVVWFMRPTLKEDGKTPVDPPTYTLYRRVFLVLPTYQGAPTPLSATVPGSPPLIPPATFYDSNDISAHFEGSTCVANTLGDLTKRECRYSHFVDGTTAHGFPHQVDPTRLVPFGGNLTPTANPAYTLNTSHARYGEDVVLTNVVSFDVRSWDPTAPLYLAGMSPNQVQVAPGDVGYPKPRGTALNTFNSPAPSGVGAFVDLNWLDATWNGSVITAPWNSALAMSPFYSFGHPKSQLDASTTVPTAYAQTWINHALRGDAQYKQPATYDTWSYHYEHDGINQSNPSSPSTADLATDGFQDDVGKYETSPPYPVPLRGIKVIIRCYEPDSRQFHEVSVVESFVPE
jgi:hypothetical protein